ncbi:hypothetical protein [Bacillus sp. AK128]
MEVLQLNYYPYGNVPRNYKSSHYLPFQVGGQVQMNATNITQTHMNYPVLEGNVCAYTPGTPIYYNKLDVKHWPSQDYTMPHPKGFAHTLHQGNYAPYRYY